MNKLLFLRATAGLSRRRLSQLTGVSATTLERLEVGGKAQWGTLGKLANALNCELLELNELAEKPVEFQAVA